MPSLLPIIILALYSILSSLADESSSYQPYTDCAMERLICGSLSINVSYPFRLSTRLDACGYPDFLLRCENNSMVIINIGNYGYQVKNIDYLNHLLTIVDTNLTAQSCPQPYKNTTLDPSLYRYTDRDQNLTLFINCAAPPNSFSTIPLYDIGCLSDLTRRRYSYFTPSNRSLAGISKNCSSTIVVPVNVTAADQMVNGELGFGAGLEEGFTVRWLPGTGWCRNCINSGGICGYNYSFPLPQDPTCFCPYGLGRGTCLPSIPGGIFKNKKIIIGLTTGVGFFLFVCLLFFLYLRWHKRMYLTNLFWKKNSFGVQTIEAAIGKYESLAPKRYKYSDVKKITKSFHDKLGQGGYGIVFKGSLKDGRLVAVKVLNDSKENGVEFINEVSSIGWTSHVNVVSLLGFCFEGSKRALIYEFMHNGSLEKYIYSESAKSTLGWENLYRIAIGIARGLEYLHHGCNSRMVHFDIKPQNILLDNEFCPKISDFGLAKLCSPKDSKLSMPVPRGTIGYIAPEVFSRAFGVASSKSDVYSYGMVVLDMVGARNNKNTRVENTSETYFPDWIYSHLEHDDDLEAWGVTNETQEIAKKLIIVGLWCIQTLPRNRPSMSMVIEMLEGSISDLKVPPKEYLSSTLESLFGTSSTWMSEDASGCM